MSKVKDGDSEAFLRELEELRGAPIGFRTFSTFYADSYGNLREYGVFVYECAQRIWFEDFEHETNLFGFTLKPRKGAPKYVKFESSFSREDILEIREVTKSAVRRCVSGGMQFNMIKKANPVTRLLAETVTELRLKDGCTLYFQFIDRNMVKRIVKGE